MRLILKCLVASSLLISGTADAQKYKIANSNRSLSSETVMEIWEFGERSFGGYTKQDFAHTVIWVQLVVHHDFGYSCYVGELLGKFDYNVKKIEGKFKSNDRDLELANIYDDLKKRYKGRIHLSQLKQVLIASGESRHPFRKMYPLNKEELEVRG